MALFKWVQVASALMWAASASAQGCHSWCNAYTCDISVCTSCQSCIEVDQGAYCASWCNPFTSTFQHCQGCGGGACPSAPISTYYGGLMAHPTPVPILVAATNFLTTNSALVGAVAPFTHAATRVDFKGLTEQYYEVSLEDANGVFFEVDLFPGTTPTLKSIEKTIAQTAVPSGAVNAWAAATLQAGISASIATCTFEESFNFNPSFVAYEFDNCVRSDGTGTFDLEVYANDYTKVSIDGADASNPTIRPPTTSRGELVGPVPAIVDEAAKLYLQQYAALIGVTFPVTLQTTYIASDKVNLWIWEPRYTDATGTTYEVNLHASGLVLDEIERTVSIADVPANVANVFSTYGVVGGMGACFAIEHAYFFGRFVYEFDGCPLLGGTVDITIDPLTLAHSSENDDTSNPA